MSEILSQICSKVMGLAYIFLALYFALALVSYNPADPSINHATDNEVTNLAGSTGAFFIDPMLQAFGYAVLLFLLFFFSLGTRMLFYKKVKFIMMRISFLLILLPLAALFLSFYEANHESVMLTPGGYIGLFLQQELMLKVDIKLLKWASFCLFISNFLLSTNFSVKNFKYIGRLFSKLFIKLIALAFIGVYSIYILAKSLLAKAFKDKTLNLTEVIEDEDQNSEKFQEEQDISPVTSIISRLNLVEMSKKAIKSDKKVTQQTLKLDLEGFILPSNTLLKEAPVTNRSNYITESALNQNSKLLQQVLTDFGINGQITKIYPGPVVTLYELEPSAGTKSSRIIGLAEDIARSMSAVSARIAVIPGKNALGIELPNTFRETVYLRELLESPQYSDTEALLPLVLGKDIGGKAVIADLAKMPHLLVAGTTGSGKSVAVNTMILSLLYRHTPKTCKFIMIDPKMLELSVYQHIPHLITPVVTEPRKAVAALKWIVKEMEDRYRAMSAMGVRNIGGYNKLIEEAKSKGSRLEKHVQTGFDKATGKPVFETLTMPEEALPYIVVIVDEMADLMLVAGKDIEASIQRLAQMARAAGIHIIMATQRPSVDIITGVIKANFPTRISFQVTSKIDSRTILNEQGAEQLLGMGDMLYMMGGGRITRVHGPFVSDNEVEGIVNFLKSQGVPEYKDEVTQEDEDPETIQHSGEGSDLYQEAVEIVLRDNRATTSYLQRCLKIGYNKAATLIEQMEREGIISAPNHAGKREILR